MNISIRNSLFYNNFYFINLIAGISPDIVLIFNFIALISEIFYFFPAPRI